jgi:hypothetical protein
MGKVAIGNRKPVKDSNGNKLNGKATSHGTFRCVRKPNSPRCKKS